MVCTPRTQDYPRARVTYALTPASSGGRHVALQPQRTLASAAYRNEAPA
jgi:hypothetical protein